MGKSKNFDVMSFLQSYSHSMSRKPIVNSEFYDVLTLTSVTRICALLLPWLLLQPATADQHREQQFTHCCN